MKSRIKNLPYTPLVIALSTALAFMATNTFAQQVDGQVTTENINSVEKVPGADSGVIQEVIVTAQKRTEKAHDVPTSISVVGQAELEGLHVSSLSDLSGYLPSVKIDNSGSPGQTAITVRGIPALGGGAVVGTYLDDTPVGSSSNFMQGGSFQLDMLPYDVSRIEVLRGPQGTLYGASTMGGLLKYVMNDPELDTLSGRIGVGISTIQGGSGAGHEERGMMNIPIIKDELAVRISLSDNRTPGYIDNVATDQSGVNATTQQAGRFALLWKPNTDFSLKFSAIHQKIDAQDQNRIELDPVTLQPIYGNQKTGTLVPQPFDDTFDYYSLSLNYNLGWADLLSASSYSRTKTHQVIDETNVFGQDFPILGFPAGLSAYQEDLDLKKFTQELRLTSKQGGKLEWLAGAFYTRETGTNDQYVSALALDGTPIAGLNPLFDFIQPAAYAEKALYGDMTYRFVDSFDVTGGVRYSKNNQSFVGNILPGGVLAPPTDAGGSSSEGVTTYMLSPRYHLSADSMLYARVATGYRPGGPNVELPGVPAVVKSDTLINYELGAKSYYLEKRASIDVAVYQINWKDIQLPVLGNTGITYTANAGTATSKGVELTSSFRITNSWRVGANAAYSDARLTEDAPGVHGLSGDRLEGIPEFTASLTSDYNFGFGDGWAAHAGGGFGFTGDRTSGESSDPLSHREPGYGILSLNADLSKNDWTLRAYVKNALNNKSNVFLYNVQDGFTQALNQVWSVRPQPRTVGIEAEYSF
jgi:iron complex outermembrane receptor protein